MNILVTGAKGFVGKNLVENLKAIRDGKNRTRPLISIERIYEYDIDSTAEELDEYCKSADFVFNLAGVNRPEKPEEFRAGNFGFASTLLDTLRAHNNLAPVMLSSSVQATLQGRFGESEYGKSKLAGEELFFSYAASTGATVYVYRFPNLVGKWVRPNYNSAVGTFCHNIANNLPVTVNDRNTELEMLFVEDLMTEMFDALEGKAHRCEYPESGTIIDGITYDGLTPREVSDGRYCYAPVTHKATLGEIVDLLGKFHSYPDSLMIPNLTPGSFEKKLHAMYVSYLPECKTVLDLNMNVDGRGSFTELLHTKDAGQVSVNITKPGVTKGLHWHNEKLEQFIVVGGSALIEERRLDSAHVERYKVSGDKIQSVIMKPGCTHSIKNIGDTDLVTIMWANENFDSNHPDTFYEVVDLEKPEFPLNPAGPTHIVPPVKKDE